MFGVGQGRSSGEPGEKCQLRVTPAWRRSLPRPLPPSPSLPGGAQSGAGIRGFHCLPATGSNSLEKPEVMITGYRLCVCVCLCLSVCFRRKSGMVNAECINSIRIGMLRMEKHVNQRCPGHGTQTLCIMSNPHTFLFPIYVLT